MAGRAPLSPDLPRFEATGDGRHSVHGSAVALDAATGLLILGPAGSGKSGLAAGLIALGAQLVADDLVLIGPGADLPMLMAPPGRPALIELRGLGLAPATPAPPVPLRAILLLAPSPSRLPEPETVALPFGRVRLLRHPAHPDLAAKLRLLLGPSRPREVMATPPSSASEAT